MGAETVQLKNLIEDAAKGGALGHILVTPEEVVFFTAALGQPRRRRIQPITAESYASLCQELENACGGSRTNVQITNDLPKSLSGVAVRWVGDPLVTSGIGVAVALTLFGVLPVEVN